MGKSKKGLVLGNKQSAKEESILYLRRKLKPGTRVYTSVSHVSRSGMSRIIHVYVVSKGEIQNITGFVAHALGWRRHAHGGMYVGGCGMDMGFHTVYTLGSVLFPPSYVEKLTGRQKAKLEGAPCHIRVFHPRIGGYMLKQEWL